MADRLTNLTRLKRGLSIAGSGINRIPNWTEGSPIGIAPTGAPVFDNISFSLKENFADGDNGGINYYTDVDTLGEYVNSTISVSNSAQIARTYVNGRPGGSVKQFISQGDYNITINLTIFANYKAQQHQDNTEVVKVGRFNSNNTFGNYLPDAELQKIITFFNTFYEDDTLSDVKVISNYLNNNFGIDKIIPYSINTRQNHDSSNSYNIIINAHSEFNDENDAITEEIIPNV